MREIGREEKEIAKSLNFFFEISADVNSILADENAYEIHSSWADEKRTRKLKFIFRRLVKIYYNYPNNFVQIKIDKYA